MAAEEIEWGGQREGATDAELAFATTLNELLPGLDYWLYADDDGTPWLLVSLDIIDDNAVLDTLRLDFDERGIRGGWSPACLNWDSEMRAEAAGIDVSGPDGLVRQTIDSPVEDLARRAAEWFIAPKNGR
ncbi:hypothetical protein [Labedaea rhizosphaerae]|uniref:Uncharacterized protein n=1 Tax=Labedaea rhizosphaerae TaxID=598644 RepID=A0A4R6SB51_LABRH|nr:hypothetical protein [Labedaea rhizosphaerae]TDP96794.1 hypothetical protein EV186_104782 [Labedaea rhizosphaerae]